MMKTRFLFLFLCTCMFGHALHAQMVTFGPLVGANLHLTSLQGAPTTPVLGYSAGAFARVKVLKFYVQPEVLFARKGATFSVPANLILGGGGDVKLRYSTVDVNLMLGLQVFKLFDDAAGLRLHTGPGISNYLNNTLSVNGNDLANQSLVAPESMAFNWQFGVGVDVLNRFFIDLRYGLGITDYGDTALFGAKSNQASILVAYKLIKDR